MRRMTLVVWVLAITPQFAAGGEDPKLQAAMELHKVASAADSASLVQMLLKSLSARRGEDTPPEVAAVMNSTILELVNSPEYAAAKARIYAEHLSLEEIRALTKVLQTPEFQSYQKKLPAITAASRAQIAALFQSKRPEIERRLLEAAQKAAPR